MAGRTSERQSQPAPRSSYDSCLEFLRIAERLLQEPYVGQLSIADLTQLEEQLKAALNQMRSERIRLMMEAERDLQEQLNIRMSLQEQRKKLREENNALKEELASLKKRKRR